MSQFNYLNSPCQAFNAHHPQHQKWEISCLPQPKSGLQQIKIIFLILERFSQIPPLLSLG